MAVHVDMVIDYLLHDAREDGSSDYIPTGPKPLLITPLRRNTDGEITAHNLTDQQNPFVLLWNEGDISLRHSMQARGAYASTTFEVSIFAREYDRAELMRLVSHFEDSLQGLKEELGVVHHNVAGFPILFSQPNFKKQVFKDGDYQEMDLLDYYFPSSGGYVPTRHVHVIEKLIAHSKQTRWNTVRNEWQGILMVELEVSNSGELETEN